MANKLPLVSIAVLCEKVLREADGVLSAIRIIDTFKANIPANLPQQALFQVTALVTLKAGSLSDTAGEVSFRLREPSGKHSVHGERFKVFLKGKQAGHSIVLTLMLPVTQGGDYSLDVLWNGHDWAVIPFKLEVTRAGVPG